MPLLSHSQQKFLTSLHVKKYRQKYRNFLLEGSKMVLELLHQTRFGVVSIWGTEHWATEHAHLLAPYQNVFQVVDDADLRKVGTLTTPHQVLAVASWPVIDDANQGGGARSDISTYKKNLHLYLDGLQDPGNMGTILRIADWFGVAGVHCSPDCVDAFSPKVIQSGMGACLRVPIFEDIRLEDFPADTPLMGAVLGGQNIYEVALPRTGVLIIGNEGQGIRPANLPLLTHRLTIPRGAQPDGAESLNAGVATGILVARILMGG
jgi:RNA methyltransferase, TrmH family